MNIMTIRINGDDDLDHDKSNSGNSITLVDIIYRNAVCFA